MERDFPLLPSQRGYQYAYELAYRLACDELTRLSDIEGQCRRSGAGCYLEGSKRVITLEYLNEPYQINLPDVEISRPGDSKPVPLRDKLLILHYFIRAKGSPLSHRIITFKELAEGSNYFPAFYKRAIKPIIDSFGRQPRHLLGIARELGGLKSDYGDLAVTINAFSRVPITLVLWPGDNEFPPEGSILFDSSISDYLATEDITVLCQTITSRLIGSLEQTR